MAVVGWILLILFGIIVLAVVLPVRVLITYEGAWCCRVLLCGCLPVYTYTSHQPARTEKPADASRERVKKQDKPSLMQELKTLYEQEGISGVLAFFSQLLRIVGRLTKRVLRAVTVRRLRLYIGIGGEAQDAAVNYGRVNAVLFPTLTALSHAVRIRKREIRVEPRFLAEYHTVTLSMTVWVWPFVVIGAAVAALFRLIAAWVRHMPVSPKPTQATSTESSSSVT